MDNEKSIMEEMQEAAEEYFSGPIPDESAYLGENIRKNYRVIQRAAAEWGAKWIAKKSGIKTYMQSPEDPFLVWLDEDIHKGKNLLQLTKSKGEIAHITSCISLLYDVKEKYLSLNKEEDHG